MSKSEYRCFLAIVILLFTSWSSANVDEAKTIKVCYDKWPPMTIFPSEDSPARGFVIDMLEQIYGAHGYRLEYYEVPLARGLSMVKKGICDMLPEYVLSEQSQNDFVYAQQPSFEYSSAFVVRRNDPWLYNGLESLTGRRIATGQGWDYSSMSPDYQRYIDNPANSDFVEVIAGNDDVVDRIFQMIKERRVDSYADNFLVLQFILTKLNLHDDLKLVQPGLEAKLLEFPIYSKAIPRARREELIKIWNDGRLLFNKHDESLLFEKYKLSLKGKNNN